MKSGEILGVHHVKVPVVNLARSREWYERLFGVEALIEFPDEDGVVRGVAYPPLNGSVCHCGRTPRLLAESLGSTRSPSSCKG